ncbi:hypothetical protein D7V80_04560 [Corallococcus sp. CA054B]|uniref:hypothetical protein n=1 Tax=Corallococcus sp. CA054B TaxID=2316734 RepID=UPI000EA368CE|nr:hypothetical protein [Corallococcus sp. CA054B]RKG70629.1 hypothetical protein D7V80_04560 [Corallococcus sp. CA054B]
MRRARLPLLVARAVAGLTLGLLAGCDLGVEDLPIGDTPPVLSSQVCYDDSDCVANACCGEGTAITHRDVGPDCTGVRCDGACTPNSVDCGRCIPTCRNARCAAACQ